MADNAPPFAPSSGSGGSAPDTTGAPKWPTGGPGNLLQDRPQRSGGSEPNPQTIPSGGKSVLGPVAPPGKPFRVSGG